MKKVLVTGADGFIGSHLSEALVNKGYDVKVFVIYKDISNLLFPYLSIVL